MAQTDDPHSANNAAKSTLKVYMFRHGEKSHHFHPNPGLSERGKAQAQRLAEKVSNSELPRPTQLWVSPKKRCQESLAVVAVQTGLTPLVVEDLDEKNGYESYKQFRERISSVWQNLAKQDGAIFICSHSDWIEEALGLIPSQDDLTQYFQWSPLQYLGLQFRTSSFHFIEHKKIPL